MKKAWLCRKCGARNPFSAWCYAHWDEELVAACSECKTRHVLLRGSVTDYEIGDRRIVTGRLQ